jgi:prepilin peptidase CpaA
MMIVGIVYCTHLKGLDGFIHSMSGIGIGMAVLIIPFLMGGMGAGDVKLMGAVGGLIGPKGVLIAFLFTALTGGIYALALLALQGYLREMSRRYFAFLKTFIFAQPFSGFSSSNNREMPKLRYGLAIALGAFLSTLLGLE